MTKHLMVLAFGLLAGCSAAASAPAPVPPAAPAPVAEAAPAPGPAPASETAVVEDASASSVDPKDAASVLPGSWACTAREKNRGVLTDIGWTGSLSYISDGSWNSVAVMKYKDRGKLVEVQVVTRGTWEIRDGVLYEVDTYGGAVAAKLEGRPLSAGELNNRGGTKPPTVSRFDELTADRIATTDQNGAVSTCERVKR